MTEKRERPRPSLKAERLGRRGRNTPAETAHDTPVGVQGPNTGYWQSVGSTRAAAKRAKRP